MLLSNIVFEDNISGSYDVAPRGNEEFHYEKGSQWIEHYIDDELCHLYNIKYVREMTKLQEPKIVVTPKEEVVHEEKYLHTEGGKDIPILTIGEPPLPKACEVCICEEQPDPLCPVHQGVCP